jgi:flavin reductase (DIM6/NTAB) family NADH-FMN oxidoreductase RutF
VTVDATEFRQLMGRWATGVTVVTAHEQGRDYGMTVNAFLSVSLNPPSILISLGVEAETTPAIERTRRFAVNVLAEGQREISVRFANTIPSAEKFGSVAFHRGEGDVPLLEGAIARFECDVRTAWPSTDHLVFVGEVMRQSPGADDSPLLFYHGNYAAIQRTGGEKPARARP